MSRDICLSDEKENMISLLHLSSLLEGGMEHAQQPGWGSRQKKSHE